MSRNAIMEALQARFASMLDATTDPIPAGKIRLTSRRLVTWDQAISKPALYISEASESYVYQSENLQKRSISPMIFVYVDRGLDTSNGVIPAVQLNDIMDAIDLALAPDNALTGRCTLGGLVEHCYISGEVPKVPGDLDGEGMAVIPINILVP